jgi:integrase
MPRKRKPQPRKLATQYEAGPHTDLTTEPGDPLGGWIHVERYTRPPGLGTYDTVTRNGHEYIRWQGYVDNAKGVRERKTVYAKTQTELTRKLKELQAAPTQRNVKKLTVEQYLTGTFLPAMRLRVRPNTYATYEQSCRVHIVPHIGATKLSVLNASHVDAWQKDLKAGSRAKQRAFGVLKRALNYAVDDLRLMARNPLERVKAPRVAKNEHRILTLHEVGKLLEAASKTRWHAIFYLAVATSMRQGELFGLRWENVDLANDCLYVRQALATSYAEEGEGYTPALAEPKTAASRRRIDLPAEAVSILEAHRTSQDPPSELVFPAEGGGFLDRTNLRKRVLLPLLKEAKLPEIRFHDLRHVGNTLLAASGVPLAILQAKLGHSTSKTTLDVYSHATSADSQNAAKRMGALLSSVIETKSETNSSVPGSSAK